MLTIGAWEHCWFWAGFLSPSRRLCTLALQQQFSNPEPMRSFLSEMNQQQAQCLSQHQTPVSIILKIRPTSIYLCKYPLKLFRMMHVNMGKMISAEMYFWVTNSWLLKVSLSNLVPHPLQLIRHCRLTVSWSYCRSCELLYQIILYDFLVF